MVTLNLVEMAKAIRQSGRATGKKAPTRLIDRDIANDFNKLLDKSKKKYPENLFIRKMQPVNPTRTQFAGLLAKVDFLENCLRTEKSVHLG